MKTITFSYNIFSITTAFMILVVISSCNKSDFLDAKPKSNLVVPVTIADYQALLETDNLASYNQTPALGEVSADNYYIPSNIYTTIGSVRDKNAYIWAADIYGGLGNQPDWNNPFRQILVANVVLEGMPRISVNSGNQQSWNETYAFALFIRAVAYWNLAQIYAPAYDSSIASKDLGLPIRLSTDINQDLLSSVPLASISFSGHLNRPSKPSVYAMISRVYLSMRAYNKALLYADSSLQLYSSLIDYNSVSTTSLQPFAIDNAESMYSTATVNSVFAFGSQSIVDSTLYKSYAGNDLRGQIFFRSSTSGPGFKYGYEGLSTNLPFSGISSSEMYLIRAECNARAGNLAASMTDLNALLIKRWKTGTFTQLNAASPAAALALILTERRKELVFRCLRWMDIRRLNKEGYNIILYRNINGQTYTLAPNSPLYTLPIPPDEIALSGIQQNSR